MNKKKWTKFLSLSAVIMFILMLTGCQNNANNTQEGKRISKTYLLSNFNSIDANMRLSDLTIKKGRDLSVVYHGSNKIVPKITVKKGKLVIDQTHKIATSVVEDSSKVVITVPANMLKDVKLKLASGDLTLDNVKSLDTVDLTAQEGDIEINDASVNKNVKCKSTEGDIEISHSLLKQANVTTQQGDIDIISSPFKGYKLSTSHGDLEFFDKLYNVKSYSKDTTSNHLLIGKTYNGDITVE